MKINWATEIAKKVELQRREMEVSSICPHYPPEPPASDAQICEVERHLGFKLDPQYRDFLCHADGWKGFILNTALFGTQDLLGQTELMPHVLRQLTIYKPSGIFAEENVRNQDLLPIAGETQFLHLFFMRKEGVPLAGRILEIQGSETSEHHDFHAFFRSSMEWDQFILDNATDAQRGNQIPRCP